MSSLFRLPILALVLASLTACQSLERFLFYPQSQLITTPNAFGFDYEDVTISASPGVNLHAWYIKPPHTPRANILFLHGNAENISTHMHNAAWLSTYGFGVLVLDYRGFGQSSGHATLTGIHQDALAGLHWLQQRNLPVVLFGQSMGASVAVVVTAHAEQHARAPTALIAEAAPASWPQIASEAMSQHFLTWPLKWLAMQIDETYDAESHIGHIEKTPVLLIHSQDDNTIGMHHSQQLRANANNNLKFLAARGPHIAAMRDTHVRDTIIAFLNEHLHSTTSSQNLSRSWNDSSKLNDSSP